MKSSSPVPERILVAGHTGAGKSETYISWAEHCRATDDPRTFYVVNADMPGTIERCNERYPSWRSNITHVDTRDWISFVGATNMFKEAAAPEDVLVIDGLDRAWVWIRDEFLRRKAERLKKTVDDNDPFGVLDIEIAGSEYGDLVNPAYDRWLFPLLDPEMNPAHLLACAPTQPIVAEGMYADDKAIVAEYGQYGVRPIGQKLNPFRFHTVLLAKHERGVYTLTTMGKDRGRESIDKEPVTAGFPFTYLGPVAGWSL